jgi:hypothetical protein
MALTLLILFSAAFATSPIRDAATLGDVRDAHLELSSGYVALAPVSAVLDAITLLAAGQRTALLVWAILAFVLARVRRRRTGRVAPGARSEWIAAGAFVAGVALVCGAAAALPRPMARLSIPAPDAFAVDFRLHTGYSADARRGWTADDARDWAHAAGFDAAYVADTRSAEGAERARATNPPVVGDGTVLLPGLDVGYRGAQVNLLGVGRLYKGLTNESLTAIDEQKLTIAGFFRGQEPVLIQTLPADLAHVVSARGPTTSGVRAIELIDGSARGLGQARGERTRIIALADSANLTLVSGSNNRGWGRAAAAWSLLRFDSWREMSPDSLEAVIDEIIRVRGRQGAMVVERTVGSGSSAMSVAFTPVVVGWQMTTALSPEERVAWLVWVWALFAGARWRWRR